MNLFFAFSIAFLYSLAYEIVGPMIASQGIQFDQTKLLPFLACFMVCSVVNVLFLNFVLPWIRRRKGRGSLMARLEAIGERKLFLLTWFFLFIAWVPAFLVTYPGVLSYDMIAQVGSALGKITINHHPVLHTWLLRVFMKLGEAVCSSHEFGIGLLSLLQMIFLSYALTRLVFLLRKNMLPGWLVILTAVLSAIWFMNACLAVTMIKDSLHSAFLVLFGCHFTEICTDASEYVQKKKNLVWLPVIGFLTCATRNDGIYVYAFCFLMLLIMRIRKIKVKRIKEYGALVVAILLPIVSYKIYTGPVFSLLDVRQGEIREALCIPIQQLQRVAVKRADELTSEQMQKMDYYIDNLAWMPSADGRAYDPFFADPAKSCFYSERYNEDPIAFWKFYFQTGEQFTKEYLTAFLSNTLGYWYPGYYEFSYVMYDNYPPESFTVPLERKSLVDSKTLEGYYESLCSSGFWRETPGLRLFFVPGFTLWMLLGALALSWKKKGYFTEVLPLFLPLIGQFGIMLLSPMSSFRYSWPFYLLFPITFLGILRETGEKDRKEEKAIVC